MKVVPGFREESAQKINDAVRRLERAKGLRGMPPQILANIESLINAAILGMPNQMEIQVGNSEQEHKKIRLAVFPAEYGEITESADGKKIRVIGLREEFGEHKEVRKDGKPC